jgi:hypothetical protein
VTYHTNSYGARDRERSRKSEATRRVVVLGDSYVEGLDVAEDARMTNLLESATGIEHLNFGTGGVFGTVQELVLYRTFASSFDHSDVMLFTLPLNDFHDNDPRWSPAKRFRPYLRKGVKGYELYYTVNFADREQPVLSTYARVLNLASNNVALINVARHLRLRGFAHGVNSAASYDLYDNDDLDVIAESYRQLAASSNGRRVFVFLIPFITDLQKYDRMGYHFPLVDALKNRIRAVPNIGVVDLLPDFAAVAAQHRTSFRQFFLPCDWHWSPLGNAVAAEAVRRHVFEPIQAKHR